MITRQTICLFALFFIFSLTAIGQAVNLNIDFEEGSTSGWEYFTGSCCPISTTTSTLAIPNRHTLTSGNAVDPYGLFPTVAPDGGDYSLRLGNDSIGAEAEKARYYIHVPAGSSNYSLIYRYAVVFQDPGHSPSQQPRFEVRAYDSLSGDPIPCAQFVYVADSALPGFNLSATGDHVFYKDWTTGSINLSGFSGKTIMIDFASGDCALGGHFGYGYLDMTAGLFAISTINCYTDSITLSPPSGFKSYAWYDSSASKLIDTTKTIIVPNLLYPTTYTLILEPYPGYGCPDTLHTRVLHAHLNHNPELDTTVCKGYQLPLNLHNNNTDTGLKYSWSPVNGLSCTECSSPVAASLETKTYVMTVTDANGCSISDTIRVGVNDSCNILIPNAFTPNGDGKDDIFRVVGYLNNFTDFSLSVFNRFGQRVFYTEDIHSGWDGIFNQTKQDVGTYFYMVKYILEDNNVLLKGDVELIR